MGAVKRHALPYSINFDFCTFLADPTDVMDWNIQGLPSDNFSTENGVLVMRVRFSAYSSVIYSCLFANLFRLYSAIAGL